MCKYFIFKPSNTVWDGGQGGGGGGSGGGRGLWDVQGPKAVITSYISLYIMHISFYPFMGNAICILSLHSSVSTR